MADVNLKSSVIAKSRVEETGYDYIRKFFKIIFEEGDIIEYGLFNDEFGLKAQRLWGIRVAGREIINGTTIATLKDDNKTRYNIYCGINPRISKKKNLPWESSGAANVKSCRWLFADCDPGKPPYIEVPKKQLLDFIKFRISKAGLPTPTLIISTGHGYHIYWKLNKKLAPDVWDPIQNNLIYTLPGDKGAKGAARVMRIPGFRNTKEKPFIKCRFEEYNENAIYDLGQITKYLKEDPEIPDGKKATDDECKKAKESGHKHDFTNLDILDWLVKAKGITEERAQAFSKTQQKSLVISCPMPFHEGEDKSPSCKINIHGKHKGICTCFACPARRKGEKFATYTIMEIILALRGYAPFDKEEKDELAVEMEKTCEGFIKYDIFKLAYPADNLDVLLKRYFTIEKDGYKMHHLWYFRGRYYYHPKKSYITYNTAALTSFIWDKLKRGKYWKSKRDKSFKLENFPVDKFRVKQIIDAIDGTRNVEANKIGYDFNEKVGDIFWIDKTRPNLPPIEILQMLANGILNVKERRIIADFDPNLFSATSLPVKYDQSLEQPENCIKTLKQNLGDGEQINEHYKRDAFLCLPYPPTHIHLFTICVGLTGSGKGTDVRFKKLWLGEHNWIEMELNVLGEKWGLQNIPGVLVIFISDDEEDEVGKQKMSLATLRIKKISGNDTLCVRLPGGTWINDMPSESLKIVYLTTNIPKFANSTDEIARRLNVEEYKGQWIEEEDESNFPDRTGSPDPDREADMAKEVDAYFTHCVIDIGMKQLFDDGHFKVTEETKEKKKEMLASYAIYAKFLTEISEKAEGERIELSKFHGCFFPWCVNAGHGEDEYKSKTTKLNITTRTLSRRCKKQVRKFVIEEGDAHIYYVMNRKLTEYGEELYKKWESQTWQVAY